MHDLIAKLELFFDQYGDVRYGPEPVSLIAHSMQCAASARSNHLGDDLIVAAGLHDIGHFLVLDQGEQYAGGGDHHEAIGANFLAQFLPASVIVPIRWHVEAKRYLVATDLQYEAMLSMGSIESLKHQGGAMAENEILTFCSVDGYEDAILLRRLDDAAKVVGVTGMARTEFFAYVERVLAKSSKK